MNFPINRSSARLQCLVVSATGIDAIRERTRGYEAGEFLEQCTVVPLKAATPQASRAGRETDIPVVINSISGEEDPEEYIADCREIYTLNWRSRSDPPPEWQVNSDALARVREALRKYLYLPQ